MSSKKESLRKKFTSMIEIPQDLSNGAALVSMTGQEELLVENYKGIIEYTSSRLILQTKNSKLEVQGQNLYIAYYSGDEMKVTGHIEQIHYL